MFALSAGPRRRASSGRRTTRSRRSTTDDGARRHPVAGLRQRHPAPSGRSRRRPASPQNPFYDEPYHGSSTDSRKNVSSSGRAPAPMSRSRCSHGVAARRRRRDRPIAARVRQDAPSRPAYQDPRVTTHVNDGRAFLENTDKKYDLILFALPDSLTLVSGASALRLESYLFTEQAMESARDHLAPGGAFSMYNFYREPWLVDRLGNTIDQAFGHAPCILSDPAAISLAVFVVGLTEADQQCDSRLGAERRRCRRRRPTTTRSSTCEDDSGLFGIPWLYVIALALILARERRVRRRGRRRATGPHDVAGTATCSCSARPSCCSRPRTSPGSRSTSARRGWSTRWCSAGCCSRCSRPLRSPGGFRRRRYGRCTACSRRARVRLARADVVGAVAAVRCRGFSSPSRSRSCRSWRRTSSSRSDSTTTIAPDHRLRREPARRDVRRVPRVPRARHRLSRAARRLRGVLPRRVPADAARRHRCAP